MKKVNSDTSIYQPYLAIFLSIILIFCLSACNKTNSTTSKNSDAEAAAAAVEAAIEAAPSDSGSTSAADKESGIPTFSDDEWSQVTEAQYDELERRCLGKYHKTCSQLSQRRASYEKLKEVKRSLKKAGEAMERYNQENGN